jgi:hypothetical protein
MIICQYDSDRSFHGKNIPPQAGTLRVSAATGALVCSTNPIQTQIPQGRVNQE